MRENGLTVEQQNALENVGDSVLTAASLTANETGKLRSTFSKYSWTNAQIAALGAVLTGNIKVCTLPAKTIIVRALLVITGQASGTTSLTASFGIGSAPYNSYMAASDLKVAANTVYGTASAELGAALTNFPGIELPSLTAATDIYITFTSTVENLSAVLGSTGYIILETIKLP